jgi:DNA ligase-1
MDFSRLIEVCERVASTTKRLKKIEILASFFTSLDAKEIAPVVLLITGQIFPESSSKSLNVSWKTIEKALYSDQEALIGEELSIQRVYEYFKAVEKASEQKKKEKIMASLLHQATKKEREYVFKVISGEMRIGASEAIILEAIAVASGFSKKAVKYAHALRGDLGETAVNALVRKELSRTMELFRPIKPMLAQMGSLEDISGRMAFEYKLDGARIQIHTDGNTVRLYSRRLTEVTASLPDIVKMVEDFPRSVTEGEVVAVKDGKPLPFQELLKRFRRIHDVIHSTDRIPLQLHLFDILSLRGEPLLGSEYVTRTELLATIANPFLVKRIITGDNEKIKQFLQEAMEAGHEGLMAKELTSLYMPGKRDKSWLKIKPVETLDLVIGAAEWGYGRREGWLSNYHLMTREGEMIGKTFKGLTDKEFQQMTEKLLTLKMRETPHMVTVTPDIVVEVAFNEIQKSPTYASGFALRFARITRIRDDKSPQEADSIQKVKGLYENQFTYKAQGDL